MWSNTSKTSRSRTMRRAVKVRRPPRGFSPTGGAYNGGRVSIDVGSVLDELTQRRNERDNAVDVALMTVVAFFEDETIGAWLRPRIARVAAKQPSRVIVLDATRPATSTSVSESGDWIEIGAGGCSPERRSRRAVGSLVHRSASVALIWASFDMVGDERFAALAAHGNTISL